MARREILITLLSFALLASAGVAEAARGDGKHARPDAGTVVPAPGQTEPVPVATSAPAAAPSPRFVPITSVPAPGPAPPPPPFSAYGVPDPAPPAAHPPAPAPTAPASIVARLTRAAFAVEEHVDPMFAASAGGVFTSRATIWSGSPVAAPTSAPGDAGAPWWTQLLWALPFAGMGGIAAVLVLRQKRRGPTVRIVPASADASQRMAPVSPFDIRGLLQNGNVAAARGALDEAVSWFDAALRVAPELGVAYFCKGVCLAANGRVSDAYGALRLACKNDPADASYRIHFARAALALGKHKEAMDSLAIVARAMPDLGPAMLEDPQLAGLRDHPRFLMICGAL